MRYESFGYTLSEMYLAWSHENHVNENISLSQFTVKVELVVPFNIFKNHVVSFVWTRPKRFINSQD